MRTPLRFLFLILPLLAGACTDGSTRDALGLNKDAPDEFSIVSRPPLSVPPEFNLRPPRPGEEPRQTKAGDTARSLLTGKPVAAGATELEQPSVETAVTPVIASETPSGAAASLLKRAGADSAQEDIRGKLGADVLKPADTSKARTLVEKLSGAEKAEPVVDAKKEAERLRSNKDAGKPATEGEVPIEKARPKTLMDRLF